MARRKPFRKTSQFEKDAVRVISIITKIEVQNQEINGKLKTVFYCKSKNPDDRMCITWGRTTFSVGDEIDMIGRFNDNVFLVWSYLYCSGVNGTSRLYEKSTSQEKKEMA